MACVADCGEMCSVGLWLGQLFSGASIGHRVKIYLVTICKPRAAEPQLPAKPTCGAGRPALGRGLASVWLVRLVRGRRQSRCRQPRWAGASRGRARGARILQALGQGLISCDCDMPEWLRGHILQRSTAHKKHWRAALERGTGEQHRRASLESSIRARADPPGSQKQAPHAPPPRRSGQPAACGAACCALPDAGGMWSCHRQSRPRAGT